MPRSASNWSPSLVLTKPPPEAWGDSGRFCIKVSPAVIEDERSKNVFVFTKKAFFLLMLCLPFYFLLSDSSALDTQVFAHFLPAAMCICYSLARACVCPHICLVFGRVRLRWACHTSELNLKTTLTRVPVFLNWSPLHRCECSMCLRAILLSLCDACPFITILFPRMICVLDWVFWPARRERYTIDESGPKHQERQNAQSWAHKIHWCGIISYFARGAPLLLSYHLSYPKLTSECVGFKEFLGWFF